MKVNQLKAEALLSYTSIFITIIVTLLYTPIMLRLLGQSEYGLDSLIGSIIGYLNMMDFGLGNAVVKYIAVDACCDVFIAGFSYKLFYFV